MDLISLTVTLCTYAVELEIFGDISVVECLPHN